MAMKTAMVIDWNYLVIYVHVCKIVLTLLQGVDKTPTPTTGSTQAPTPSPACDGFLCANSGVCIPSDWECDDYDDCGDNSDEAGCGGGGGNTPAPTPSPACDGFLCANSGVCIPSDWECDDYDDCGDNSDEAGCGGGTNVDKFIFGGCIAVIYHEVE
ncbi:hypothetical protein CAPTEDRAFT_205500 [Capitella teleta]|uniref:Uncharacterized protein n=1 Tax=Capitella teleta TaxID=283909 RepID=R7VAS2_CAPTE|nr:hypothetical protein CAPTEDRAFT_205500 [Capitella teleta]|eukprot:ELU13441.1 hypothetical protein CAPTEDRAFT_205500 [Capitella teleta]